MTPEQIQIIKCAHADLAGVYQSIVRDQNVSAEMSGHDWASHRETIEEMEANFAFLEHIPLGDEEVEESEESDGYGETQVFLATHGDYPCIDCPDSNVSDGCCVNQGKCKAFQLYENWGF